MSRKFAYKLLFYCLFVLYLVGDLHVWHGFFAGMIDERIKKEMVTEVKGSEVKAIVYGVPVTQKQIDRRVAEVAFLRDIKQGADGKWSKKQTESLQASAKLELLYHEILRTKARYNDMRLSDTLPSAALESGRLASRFGDGQNSFSSCLLKQKTDEQQFVNMIAGRLKQVQYLNQTLKDAVVVDEDAIKSYYDEMSSRLSVPRHRNLKHIFLATLNKDAEVVRQEALGIYQQILQGGSFEELARQYSEDEATSGRGGDLSVVSAERENLLKGVDLFELPEGQVSLRKSELGWHIFQAGSIQESRMLSYEEARPLIISALNSLRKDKAVAKYFSDNLGMLRREQKIWEKPAN